MKVKQISIFIENKPGKLASICRALAADGISIVALSLADTADFGIVRMIVDDHVKGCSTLAAAGFAVRETEVVVVTVPDRPGGMADLMERFDKAGVDIQYAYAYAPGAGDKAVLVIKFSDNEKALTALAG